MKKTVWGHIKFYLLLIVLTLITAIAAGMFIGGICYAVYNLFTAELCMPEVIKNILEAVIFIIAFVVLVLEWWWIIRFAAKEEN